MPAVKPLDLLVIAAALVLLTLLYMHYWRHADPAAMATVSTTEKTLHLSLLQDGEVDVHGPLGISRLQVKKGRIRFLSSPCPHQYCVNAGWLSRPGEVAACLPNRISVHVGANSRFDSINF